MKSLNQVQLIGHLGNDPETKEYEGKMVSKFSLATGEECLDKATNEKRKSVEWHRIICFNKMANIAKTYFKKGTQIYLAGKLKTTKWQDKNNTNHYTTEIVVDDVIMLDEKKSDSDSE